MQHVEVGKPYIIIIVTSYVGHVELRSAHRRAIPKELLDSMNVTRIFLLAKIPPHEKYINQNAIEDESRAFGDILQGSFIEDYRNLTFKHLMGLQWASTNCSEAFYILKVDDDTVFNLERTYKLLKSLRLKGDFFMGYMLNNTKPIRKHLNKWYVTWEEYPRNDYPPYLSGWYYITTPNAARRVTNEAIYHPYFWIDDLLITGLLTEALNIKLVQVPKGFWLEYYELLECCLRDMIKEKIIYISQNVVEYESRAFGDILQGSFVESYRSLIFFKHLMGLQWASTNCSEAVYILKVDDDTVFNWEKTYKLIKSLRLKGDFFMGYMLNDTKPVRKHLNKWYVTWEEYPRDDYPPYLSGALYITTPNAARRIQKKFENTTAT
ncbi:hypothetical protein MSG28_006951 [Choristoneura fumiferana]|uniref:Uncharacterized protein n=1 Tax=Choristoneura fumiferana TaxID=7141 RepID=A0ACC0JLQ7_CHOFU|nr:hypothetical protein MSG28_006951 [Choristoneura fumiferana]